MSRRLMKVYFAAALVVVALGAASAASAATWHTNATATTMNGAATAGASQLRVDSTAGVQGLTCTNAGIDVTWEPDPLGAGTPKTVATFTPTFATCLVVGQSSAVKCASASLQAVSYSAPTTTGSTSNLHCVMVKTNGSCGNATTFTGGGITIAGSVTGTYGNTSQQLTINTAGQNLNVSWSSTGCLQGTGTGTAKGTFSNASGTNLVYSSTSTFRGRLTFTP
jgi:hypothetical protein